MKHVYFVGRSLTYLVLILSLSSWGQSLRVMSYNVQNLFDTRDNPNTRDEDFTLEGEQKWEQSVLEDKFQNLGRVVKSVNPDILAVQEIENQEILDEWVKKALVEGAYSHVITEKSDDPRGVRTGLITRLPVVKVDTHQVWNEKFKDSKGRVMKTRDILEVELKGAKNSRIFIFVNHWPSKGGGSDADRFRKFVATQLREILETRQSQFPTALILALGDFNEGLDEGTFASQLPLIRSFDELKSDSQMGLLHLGRFEKGQITPADGTFFFHPEKSWNLIDHFFWTLNPVYLKSKNPKWLYKKGSYGRVSVPEEFLGKFKNPQGCEILEHLREYQGRAGNRCPKGAADHFPIKADFQWTQ